MEGRKNEKKNSEREDGEKGWREREKGVRWNGGSKKGRRKKIVSVGGGWIRRVESTE